jgi:uncharacterized repeat protein (TIGR04076 family)
MPTCKITVLKKMFNQDLADEYRRPDIHRGPCPYFTEGQEFVVEYLGERPEAFFCDWAWNDIQKILFAMMVGGDFGSWMKDGNTFITCCTDGIKPVVFKLERTDN